MPSLFGSPTATTRNTPWVPVRGFTGRTPTAMDDLVRDMFPSGSQTIGQFSAGSAWLDLIPASVKNTPRLPGVFKRDPIACVDTLVHQIGNDRRPLVVDLGECDPQPIARIWWEQCSRSVLIDCDGERELTTDEVLMQLRLMPKDADVYLSIMVDSSYSEYTIDTTPEWWGVSHVEACGDRLILRTAYRCREWK